MGKRKKKLRMPEARPVSPRWEAPETVDAFVSAKPNKVLMTLVEELLGEEGGLRVLDIGCGAGRNAIPMAELGADVVGTDLSEPMLAAARRLAASSLAAERLRFVTAGIAPLPFGDDEFDLIVAHGIWNLSISDQELRAGIAEAARVSAPGATLFLFTFSRNTLAKHLKPVEGQRFIYTEFNGEPQCFLTEDEVFEELQRRGFEREVDEPLTEYNRPPDGQMRTGGPVIYEGIFRRF